MNKPQNHKQLKTNGLENGLNSIFKNSPKTVTKRNQKEPGDTIRSILKIMNPDNYRDLIQTKTPKKATKKNRAEPKHKSLVRDSDGYRGKGQPRNGTFPHKRNKTQY